jgi:type IV pilus biogenesis protein CpaD/CtpE
MSKSIPLMCLGLLIAGCARPPAPIAPQAQIKKELPVICRLVNREQTVTISAGENGSVYSVQDAAGKTLLSYASRDELRVQFPVLSRQLDSAIVEIGPLAGH